MVGQYLDLRSSHDIWPLIPKTQSIWAVLLGRLEVQVNSFLVATCFSTDMRNHVGMQRNLRLEAAYITRTCWVSSDVDRRNNASKAALCDGAV